MGLILYGQPTYIQFSNLEELRTRSIYQVHAHVSLQAMNSVHLGRLALTVSTEVEDGHSRPVLLRIPMLRIVMETHFYSVPLGVLHQFL